MNYPFSQPNIIYQVSFEILYKDLLQYEEVFSENSIGISSCEVASKTVENMPDDLWKIEILFEDKPDLVEIEQKLENVPEAKKGWEWNLELKVIKDKDWVKEYQEQLKPLVIDEFFITNSRMQDKCPEDKKPIYIEASRAFGTGDHATTSLCIEALRLIEEQNIKSIFDIGTGSGILSFAAEKIWSNLNVLACDIEQVAVEIAKENTTLNNSSAAFYQNTEEDLCLPDFYQNHLFEVVISNILAQPLINLAPEIKKLVPQDGWVILSGFLDYQSEQVQKAYQISGFAVKKVLEKDSWICLLLQKK
ncbi:MAG: hypothetical protein DGJ47_000904 [Rickettsiaceae bacterium]